MKKRLFQLLAVALGLIVLLLVGSGLLAKSMITKAFLEKELESSINSDVSIGDVDVSIFSIPAKVTIRDLSLKSKEGDTSSVPPVKIEELSLSAGLFGLLQKHIDITDISIRGAEINMTYYEDGSSSLEKLFESPDKRKNKEKREPSKGGFNAFDQEDMVTSLGGLSIKRSEVTIHLKKMGLRLQCMDVDLNLSSIKIDPSRLANTNSADLELSSHIRIDSDKGWQVGDIDLSGVSSTRIFNPETGDVEPDVKGDFSLGEKSWLNTQMPFISRAWSQLSVLEKIGVKVAKIPEKATFGRSEAIAAHYHQGMITVEKPLSIWVGDWEMAALDKSWLQTQSDQHTIYAELLASQKSSKMFRKLVDKGVGLIPREVRTGVAQDVDTRLFPDGRLLVKMKSSGDFSNPKVRPDGVIMDFTEAAKQSAKKILRKKAGGILRGLLGGGEEEEDE